MSAATAKKQAQARELKHRVLTCLHKLSDRDTHAAAASELESIARSLSSESLPLFLSSITATDSSDKSPVRRHCVRLISVLSEHHGNSLSPHLSKLLSAVVRRLCDPDSSVRSACVAAALSVASQLTSQPFTSIAKPFLESLFVEQDPNSQAAAALSLAAIIEGSSNPDAVCLRKLLPRLEKLAKCESFKAKAALLALIGSTVGVNAVISDSGKNEMKNLLICVMEFLGSEDWAARKAAAEALTKMAYAEKALLSEYKASCLKAFEAKRSDKVKATRETMNQMIEAWNEIPDLPDELLGSPASSKENAGEFHHSSGFKTPEIKKIRDMDRRASLAAAPSPFSAPRRRLSLECNPNLKDRALFRKLDCKKKHSKLELAGKVFPEDNQDGDMEEIRVFEQENQMLDGSEPSDSAMAALPSNEPASILLNPRDLEDLSVIRNQLLQIENQQTHLLDLFERFIGSSQSGIQSLDARVHGLELAIDEISYEVSRTSQNSICCRLPVTDFWSTKLRRHHANPPQFPLQRRRLGPRGLAGA